MKFDETLSKCVNTCLDNNIVPMLVGEPGIGKSSWIEALAKTRRTRVFTLQCNLLADKADLTGARLVPNGKDDYKQVFYPHDIVTQAIDYAKDHPREEPILFLDEINRTTSDVTSAILGLSTARTIGSKSLPENLRLIVAGNDKGNVVALDKASISRFVICHVQPDTQTYLSIETELNPFIKNVLTAHPECLYGEHIVITKDDDDDDGNDIDDYIDNYDDGEDMSQITTPRTVSALSRFLNGLSNQDIIKMMGETIKREDGEISVLQEIIEGHVGETRFTTFLIEEITSNIVNVNNQANTVKVVKPKVYDDMKKCTDRQSLSDFFSKLDERELSGILAYALCEKEDNEVYITTIVDHLDKVDQTDFGVLWRVAENGDIDKENLQILFETNSKVANFLTVLQSYT